MEPVNGYTLGKELGKGSFGTVYQATKEGDDKQYAIKQIIIDDNDKESLSFYNREIENLKHKHPYIIKFIESFKLENKLYIVMEFADNENLEKIFKNLLSEDEVLYYSIQICLATQFMRKKHIMHRDLKPENVLLMKDGTVKVADFGVSRQLANSFATGSTDCGTEGYMAPEINSESCHYSYKVDVYSIGVIMYKLCNKIFPNREIEASELEFDNEYSQELQNLVKKCLESDPDNRFDINELLQSEYIQKWVAGQRVGNCEGNKSFSILINYNLQMQQIIENTIDLQMRLSNVVTNMEHICREYYEQLERNKNYVQTAEETAEIFGLYSFDDVYSYMKKYAEVDENIFNGLIKMNLHKFKNSDDKTVFEKACEDNDVEFIRNMLKSGVRAEKKIIFEVTDKGNAELAKLFINKSNVDLRDENDEALIHHAVRANSLDIVVLLLDNGCDINIKSMDGMTPLLEACKAGNLEIINKLLENECRVDIPDNVGNYPLHWVAKGQAAHLKNLKQIVEILVNHGCDKSLTNNEGKQAWQLVNSSLMMVLIPR